MRFEQCLGTFTVLLVEESSKTGFFTDLSNHVLGVRNIGNTKTMRVNLFFRNIQNFIYISKMQQKNEKKFRASQITASELLSLNCPYEELDTFHRHSVC